MSKEMLEQAAGRFKGKVCESLAQVKVTCLHGDVMLYGTNSPCKKITEFSVELKTA